MAIATPPGRGGIACVRLSGPDAVRIARGLIARGERLNPTAGAPHFDRFLDRRRRPLDHGYCVTFPKGRSYTGEETVELWTHGSPAVLGELCEAAMAHGARAAGPGEFTYRALRHGRLDLARAEAVRDLIEARSAFQARVAFGQAEGALSKALAPLRGNLAELLARGEAAVEFVDESETHLGRGQLDAGIAALRERCGALLAQFETGRYVREGAAVAITGLPNAGKSSLFNRLLARDRAIVHEAPGTTRDTLEETLLLDGVPVRLIDTAGLREVVDPVEGEGVRRAERARREADRLLLVLDGSRPEPTAAESVELANLSKGGPQRAVIAINKADLANDATRAVWLHAVRAAGLSAHWVSATGGEGVDALREALRVELLGPAPTSTTPVLTNARHAAALRRADEHLAAAGRAAQAGYSEELVLEDLREAMRAVGEITGEFGTDELYDLVFSTFCIGK